MSRIYSVKEMYLTLQGEGAQAGRAAVFLRFSGCNLWSGLERDRARAVCDFCDTDFVGTDGPGGGKFDTAEALAATDASFDSAREGRRLASETASLRQDFRALGDDLLPRLPPPSPILLGAYWEEATEALENAERLLAKDFIPEGILPMEKALARMVYIEDQLTVRMTSQDPSGSGQGLESETPPQASESSQCLQECLG